LVEAGYAEVDYLLPEDLTLQLLLAHSLDPSDQSFNLSADILVKIFLGDNRWLRVGNGIDPDEVVITPPRMNLPGTALAV
jgi:hypothetical protein